MNSVTLCTGIAQCGEKEYLRKFERYASKRDAKLEMHHLGQMVMDIAKRDYRHADKHSLLDFPESTLHAWRGHALENILESIEDSPEGTSHIVDAHMTYWDRGGAGRQINPSYVRRLNPDHYVQIVDYEVDIYNRLRAADNQKHQIPLDDVVRWQEHETFTTRTLANYNDKPFSIIAKNQPPSTLYETMFEDLVSIYQAYPITAVRKDPKVMSKIRGHVGKMHDICTVSDPGTIELTEEAINGEHSKLIDAATVRRDFQLIDQNEEIVVYFPVNVTSTGVMAEIEYAGSTGKPVSFISPDGYTGPFTERHIDNKYTSPKKFYEDFKKNHKGRVKE